jgi:hypothetical protein
MSAWEECMTSSWGTGTRWLPVFVTNACDFCAQPRQPSTDHVSLLQKPSLLVTHNHHILVPQYPQVVPQSLRWPSGASASKSRWLLVTSQRAAYRCRGVHVCGQQYRGLSESGSESAGSSGYRSSHRPDKSAGGLRGASRVLLRHSSSSREYWLHYSPRALWPFMSTLQLLKKFHAFYRTQNIMFPRALYWPIFWST